MFYYAQLNENNICVGVSMLSGEVNASNMVQISDYSEDYIYRKYDAEAQTWGTEKYEPETNTRLTEFEEARQRISDIEMALAAIMGGAV
ncbi:hypothetical protein CDQ84_12180 [Clostridium thermosuccinogenes]|uniref:Uncharacterized protein n=1 Tax=Clostridium thermosuccinogenes TaxID=84032 RepID=A0A2K2FGN0_9CLOT|nr:hypothetical protein [Pseudoclostridium thermosuccinogenes]AUS95048.1 hypothetical protein CDO33_00420 [Pseudoclostridium thermosuccinogenes]PNT96255.1 hypothetical protein CDQ85_12220 [Pseudoclostridium thermosuccinogenes]PNT97937.1 hypothetical protein CDQ84_12180 [Pseudoclostridium thermosuccinogenes]